MIPDSLEFILRPVDDEQAEYAAASTRLPAAPSPAAGRYSEAAVRKGSQAASSVKSSASPDLPQGGADTDSSDADAVGAPASEGGPRWSAVDDERGSLLDLLGDDGSWLLDDWPFFRGVLKKVATDRGGLIDQNIVRPLLQGEIKPQRIGALYRRAMKEGLIRRDGWTTTDNSESGNTGRPAPAYRWLGTT